MSRASSSAPGGFRVSVVRGACTTAAKATRGAPSNAIDLTSAHWIGLPRNLRKLATVLSIVIFGFAPQAARGKTAQ